MPRIALGFWVACGLLCAASAVYAAAASSGPLRVRDAWARATPPGADVAAGYLVVDNSGGLDRLRSVSTDAAQRAELHQMQMDHGVMRMRQVLDGLPVAAGGKLVLAPRGAHIKVIGPKHPFVAGGTLKITLHFEHAGALEAELPIVPIGASGPPPSTAATTPSAHTPGTP